MSTIWKKHLELADRQVISLPQGAKILTVARQGEQTDSEGRGTANLWARVEPDRMSEDRIIRIFGTGYSIPEELVLDYLGAVMYQGGSIVFHYFEEL